MFYPPQPLTNSIHLISVPYRALPRCQAESTRKMTVPLPQMVWRPPTFTEEATTAFAGMAVVSGIEFAVLKAVGQLTEQ